MIKQYLNEYNFYKDCIGDLTLLKLSPNSGANNNSFSDKKNDYKVSLYYMTSNIIKPAQNNRRSGQQFDALNYINNWNPQCASLTDDNGQVLEINDHWTKEAIIA